MGMPFGLNMGAVRPIGKIAGYDSQFQALLDDLALARSQGLVDVISTYDQAETGGLTIGAVKTGGYPLNPRFVMQAYRSIASNLELLNDVLDSTAIRALQSPENIESLVLKGVGDGAINNIPSLPLLESEELPQDALDARTCVARGRIGAVIKFSGFCESKELVPMYLTDGYSRTIASLINNTRDLLIAESDDQFWVHRNRVLSLAFETVLDPRTLDKLSIAEILKLRTREWGKFEQRRHDLISGAFELANAANESDDFNSFVKERLVEIRKTAAEIETQRKTLGFRIKCDLGAGALTGGLSLLTLQAPLNSVAAILALGGIWALHKTQSYAKEIGELKNTEKQANRGAGFAMSKMLGAIENQA
ncbi:hypothetical protein UC8_38560 [Roseimaritima ulvae]|uniref:Uncharacterized protein n=2 Tax=Roseimaritima ulvae TaxID=980254 RepID=A0A5B9QS05_9BACT|nr:hypothetical protein UC8_38560 [Roseimaritima ulvae]